MTLELSNVANLPITIYHGMKIGQLSFMQMTEPAATPYGSAGIGSKYQGQTRADAEPVLQELRIGRMKVLVTGGTGFIGGHVVHALRARDLPVRALVRDPRRASRLAAWGAELVEGDVADAGSLAAACDGLPTRSSISSRSSPASRAEFERVMAQGTRDLVAAAKEAGVRRFVLMSALGLDERSRDAVPYFGAKWEMEAAVRESGLEHVIFRPSFVFGKDGGALAGVQAARAAGAGDADRR